MYFRLQPWLQSSGTWRKPKMQTVVCARNITSVKTLKIFWPWSKNSSTTVEKSKKNGWKNQHCRSQTNQSYKGLLLKKLSQCEKMVKYVVRQYEITNNQKSKQDRGETENFIHVLNFISVCYQNSSNSVCPLLAGSVQMSLKLWKKWFSDLKHSSFVKFLGRLISEKSCFTSSKIPVLFPFHFQRVNCHNIFLIVSRWMEVKTIINKNGNMEIWKYHQLCVRLWKRHSDE